MSSLFMKSSATFSPCGRYRYTLERIWSDGGRIANFVMLNPSSADAVKSDATIERQIRRVQQWGYDGLVVTNIYAWRSTDPMGLLVPEDAVGPDNEAHVLEQASRAAIVVCGWGSFKHAKVQAASIRLLLELIGVQPYALKVTNGRPWHPLYISYAAKPFPLEALR